MILGPNDPRGKLSPEELEEARANTKKWNAILGIKPMSKKQKAEYDAKMEAILGVIGWKDES